MIDRLHGKLVATYESAATRRFQLGRVDNIRSASSASLAWVKAMADPDSSVNSQINFLGAKFVDSISILNKKVEEQIRLFYKAADNQTNVMVKNILGQGIDNHLLGLRQLAKHINIDTATDVFQDPSFQIVHHFALSTSQVRIPHYLPLFFQSLPPLINRKKKRIDILSIFFPP
jgi:choline O-acetyltransferase